MRVTQAGQGGSVSPSPILVVASFIGRVQVAASAGRYGSIQLLNPSGSGLTAQLRYLAGRVQSAGDVRFQAHDTALTTDVATERNLQLGGAGATCQLRSEQPVAIPGTNLYDRLLAANTWTVLVDRPLFWLDAAKGLVLSNATANDEIELVFQWSEQ